MPMSQQNHVFVDPEHCGSGIGYYLNISEYEDKKAGKTKYSLNATIVFSDCSHKIDWMFGEHDGSIDKVDAAIKILQEFRKKYSETEKHVKLLNK